jgi:tRNA (mo5U34)-methyltransferase
VTGSRPTNPIGSSPKDPAELKEEIIRLGPWHLDVQVTPEVSSSAFLEAPDGTYESGPQRRSPISFISDRARWQGLVKQIYPEGFDGHSFLDCACNCGGYSFWTKELGAGRTFGFDVREHWIRQAIFLLENRVWPSDGIRFEILDLYDLPNRELEPFDVTLFKGIFYHLPDPIAGLKLAADMTREVLILDTNARVDLPDGMLVLQQEGTAPLMSGVYGLNWVPTGPDVMARILGWMGFGETRLVSWAATESRNGEDFGRLRIIGAREPGRLDRVEQVTELARTRPPDA